MGLPIFIKTDKGSFALYTASTNALISPSYRKIDGDYYNVDISAKNLLTHIADVCIGGSYTSSNRYIITLSNGNRIEAWATNYLNLDFVISETEFKFISTGVPISELRGNYTSYFIIYPPPNATDFISGMGISKFAILASDKTVRGISDYTTPNWYPFFAGSLKPPFGNNSEEGGGNGEYDDTTGNIDFPTLPTVSALSSGLVKMYNPTIEELRQIGNFLWTTDFAVNIAKLFADPMESLISLNLFPVSPNISENKTPIRFGNINAITGGENPSQIASNPLTNQFVQFDCGKINLSEYWGSALDYSPYTKAELYLPFISTQSIDIDDIMNAELHLVYNIDMLTGGCTALLKVTKNIDGTPLNSVLYSWGGNMATQIPLFATDYTQKINSLINATIGVGVTALSGGSGMAIASGVVGGAMNIAGAKPHIQKGSSLSMATGSLANFTPYIILTRPIQSKPENYQHYIGWTSNITKTIGELTGFTQIEYVHIENMGSATSDEKNEIEQLLKNGVII